MFFPLAGMGEEVNRPKIYAGVLSLGLREPNTLLGWCLGTPLGASQHLGSGYLRPRRGACELVQYV